MFGNNLAAKIVQVTWQLNVSNAADKRLLELSESRRGRPAMSVKNAGTRGRRSCRPVSVSTKILRPQDPRRSRCPGCLRGSFLCVDKLSSRRHNIQTHSLLHDAEVAEW